MTNPIYQALGVDVPAARRLRDTIADKLAMLPAVDHNGHPVPPADGGTRAVAEEAGGAVDVPPARPPLAAPQGPQSVPRGRFGAPALDELSFSQKNAAVAYATRARITFAEAVETLAGQGW